MPEPRFTHLHVHTHYSLLDGACKVPDLIKRTKVLGMDSIAITDHGCMFGVVEFFNEAKKEGIKPIIGMEAYMAPGDRRERSTPTGNAGEAAYHLLLLAQNQEGYRNLIKLSSIAYREGFYYKPRIDKDVLREYSRGLIATSACLGGEVCSALARRDAKNARKVAEIYADIFGPERFFIEVQKQGIELQDQVNPELVEVAGKLGLGIVGTNDVHFLCKDDHFAHNVLCCISMGRLVSEPNPMPYPQHLYLKSPSEMAEALAGLPPEAMSNTQRIAGMCELELDFSKRYAPVYRVPTEKLAQGEQGEGEMKQDERYLRQLCQEGLEWRYGTREVSPEVRDRLEKELKVIVSKNFCSYFLIVWDFCNYARDHGIPVGARGSGVGTMVGYLLGLCNVDPIRYGLLFERFMDPSRNEMPDIDIDICQDGRAQVIEYVRQKYGHVAQIITFGTLAARAACKDVGRVLGVPLAEIDKLTKLIPGTPGMTLDKALAQAPDLRKLHEENPTIRNVIDLAKKLEGLCRNAGCHAAGVIIADQPLDTLIPLYRDSDGNVLTQFEGPVAEKVGLLKMDFLGLRTLSVITRAVRLVERTRGIRIDVEKLDVTDKNVLGLFCRGETRGVFQFESGGMQDLLMKMQPDRLEDLIAANALYRPGPMELIPTYCNRKHGREPVPRVHPLMDAILEETYGIMVYQEQVMQIFNQLGGIELASAYKLIKAISKKTTDVIARFRPEFIKGCTAKGIAQSQAEELFDLILKFGGYGFNKSHSTRYAIVAFQTAYLKANHPVEFMAAVLTYEMGNTDKVVEYIEECRRMGLKVLPPDVNVSAKDFTPVYMESEEGARAPRRGAARPSPQKEGVIRFGLCAVRGVGEKAVEAIIAERDKNGPFRSLYDFCERVDLRVVQRATIEALIKCGAFAGVSPNRAQLLHVLERAFEMGQQAQTDKRMGQLSMFGEAAQAVDHARAPGAPLPGVDEFQPADLLKFEKELLGFYITSHPLTAQQQILDRYATASSKEAKALPEGTEVTLGGMITRVKKVVTRSGRSAGQPMGILTLEDLDGQIDATLFAEAFAEVQSRCPESLKHESIVLVRGRIDRKRETPSLLVNELIPIEQAVAKLTRRVGIKLDATRHDPGVMVQVKERLARHKGSAEVFVQVQTVSKEHTPQKVIVKIDKNLFAKPSRGLVDDLEQLLGGGSVELFGDGSARIKRLEQRKLFVEPPETQPAASATSEDAAIAEMDEAMV